MRNDYDPDRSITPYICTTKIHSYIKRNRWSAFTSQNQTHYVIAIIPLDKRGKKGIIILFLERGEKVFSLFETRLEILENNYVRLSLSAESLITNQPTVLPY